MRTLIASKGKWGTIEAQAWHWLGDSSGQFICMTKTWAPFSHKLNSKEVGQDRCEIKTVELPKKRCMYVIVHNFNNMLQCQIKMIPVFFPLNPAVSTPRAKDIEMLSDSSRFLTSGF